VAWLDVALLASDLFLGVAETLFQLQLSIVVLLSKSVRMRSVGQLGTGLGCPRNASSSLFLELGMAVIIRSM
jgi:hypothetical protein